MESSVMTVDQIKPFANPVSKDKLAWGDKINMYHLIQQRCDRPAYFWYNYKWKIPTGSGHLDLSTPEVIDQGWTLEIYREFFLGNVDPQRWCDQN